jgi:hypothetical protein
MRGRKPKPMHLRLIDGNRGKRALPPRDPLPSGSIERPAGLRGRAAKLWDEYIGRAWWLTWADGPPATVWVHLMVEYQRAPARMIASRIAQLRALASTLGFDPAARARMGLPQRPHRSDDPPDPGEKYISDPAQKYFK